MTEAAKPAEMPSANATANIPATARPEVPEAVPGGAPLDGATLGTSALSVPVAKRDPGGAPRGNLNALKHGGKMMQRLTLGELPKELNHVKRMARSYRRALEDAVSTKHGMVSLAHAHVIDEAAGWELHAGICRWQLQHKFLELSSRDLLACSRNIADARTARNRAVAALGLNEKVDIVASWYRSPEEAPEATVTQPEAQPCT